METTLTTAHGRGRNGTPNTRDSENRDCTVLFMQLVTFAISPYGFGLHFLKPTVYTITSLLLSCLHGIGESPVRWSSISLSHRPIEERLTSPLHCDQSAWVVSVCGAHLLYQRCLCECELTGVLHSQLSGAESFLRKLQPFLRFPSSCCIQASTDTIGCVKWMRKYVKIVLVMKWQFVSFRSV